MKDAKVTLFMDLTNPRALELFPLIFAYNHVVTESVRAMRTRNTASVVSLQVPLQELRRELERRGVLGYFLKLKRLETQRLIEEAEGGPDERSLN